MAGLLSGLSLGQSSLAPPQIGFLQDSTRTFRPLLGISGNFWLGEAVARGLLAAASSGQGAMVKTNTELRVYDALGHQVGDALRSRGGAVFGFTRTGSPALAWLSLSGELQRWNGARFQNVRMAAGMDGEVISLAEPDSSTAAFLVKRGEELWRVDVSLANGGVTFQGEVAGATAPALLLSDGTIVYGAENAVVVHEQDGSERRVAMPGTPAQIGMLAADWLRIESGSVRQAFALRLSAGALFILPGAGR